MTAARMSLYLRSDDSIGLFVFASVSSVYQWTNADADPVEFVRKVPGIPTSWGRQSYPSPMAVAA
jgi:hypothetical protein